MEARASLDYKLEYICVYVCVWVGETEKQTEKESMDGRWVAVSLDLNLE